MALLRRRLSRALTRSTRPVLHAIDKLSAALSSVVSPIAVNLAGAWSTSLRKTYASPSQAGTGAGPFVEVVDAKWQGTFECNEPMAGIAFLATDTETFWTKSAPRR